MTDLIKIRIKFSPDLLDTYKGLGEDWQTQMDNDLKEIIAHKYERVERAGKLVTVEREPKSDT